ncbi:hypothetical protein HanPI659440_Chr06g0231531 [Helianthus annuus]|nr:hypothetical protein HanPI659440_Chr06g0231531 [Helianthus annuus]
MELCGCNQTLGKLNNFVVGRKNKGSGTAQSGEPFYPSTKFCLNLISCGSDAYFGVQYIGVLVIPYAFNHSCISIFA